MIQFAAEVDARKYEPRDKHTVIFDTFNKLNSRGIMQLINDHDPRPLHYQFLAEYEGKFEWTYLEEGPETWRVAIGKK